MFRSAQHDTEFVDVKAIDINDTGVIIAIAKGIATNPMRALSHRRIPRRRAWRADRMMASITT
jgi:hypothetical protein